MKAIYVLSVLVLLAACEKPAAPAAPAVPIAQAPAPVTAPANALTPQGWAGVRIGMTNDEAVAALGQVTPEDRTHNPDWQACHMIRPVAPEGVWVMVENDRVTRITVNAADNGLKTDKGIGVGDTPEAVRAGYPMGLVETPHKYEAAPAMYLTHWTTQGVAGVRYSIASDGKVREISVGGPSIEYVEGCS